MKKRTKTVKKRTTVEMVREVPKVRLDLACGQSPREGFEGVDLYAPNAKHKVDLFKFPFPWKSNSVDEIHCSHFIEHLPAREVEERDIVVGGRTGGEKIIGKDFLFAFMDECWRVLKNEGTMRIHVPNVTHTRAFQDPTHRRFITSATFFYFAREWREQQKLNHYNVACDFGFNCVPIVPIEETLQAEEVQRRRFTHDWNVILDWQADLVAKKL